jgi:serine/threonine protein kinase
MSPEQAKSEPLDHRSDLYSLAVCMYEILTGERLFVAAGITTSADEIYSQPVPQLSRKVPGLPPDIDAIMAKALALDPAKRYQTAGEFQEALMRCAHRNGLLMSAPELAQELLAACGPPEAWRGDEDDEDVADSKRAGTEVYDPGDEDDDDEEENLDNEVPLSIHSIAARATRSPTPPASNRPKTEVGKFAGVELTSIINMMDLDDQGSRPLVDLDDSQPAIRSSPPPSSRVDSDPSLGRFVKSLSSPSPPSELVPTVPRQQFPPQGAPNAAERTWRGPPVQARAKGKAFLRPWMVILVLVLAAIVTALIVALSGPNIPNAK